MPPKKECEDLRGLKTDADKIKLDAAWTKVNLHGAIAGSYNDLKCFELPPAGGK
jgi:hypothetical protein